MSDNQTIPVISLDKIEKIDSLIDSEYNYKGFTFQRMTRNLMWHVVYDNRLVNVGQYRHDLEQWVDEQYKKLNIDKIITRMDELTSQLEEQISEISDNDGEITLLDGNKLTYDNTEPDLVYILSCWMKQNLYIISKLTL